MIPVLTRQAVRALDRDAVERLGVPSVVLMENAGLGAARSLLARFATRLQKPVVLGGTGQNGGDAWVVARQLLIAGETPMTFIVGSTEQVKGDARVNLDALRALGHVIWPIDESFLAELPIHLASASVIIDGLFGTGLDRPIQGLHARVIECVNAAARPVFALDLPSGIDADTGQILGHAIRAEVTATFAAHKLGLHQHPGAAHAGDVELVSIGVPPPASPALAIIESRDVARVLPPRKPDAHKGTNGHIIAFAGSPGKTGAAALAGTAALRAGAGLVTIASCPETVRALDAKVIEVMTAELNPVDLAASALVIARDKASALLGPGFGLSEPRRAALRTLALELTIPCVLDADALTAIETDLALLQTARGPRVLTPHPGEAARLLGTTTAQLASDRPGAARTLAQRSGHVVVLKGAGTLIASPEGSLRICRSGTPALGTAGTGDVLSGVIAALCATCPPFDAAWAGVELHAQAGEIAAASDRGLLANEVAVGVPHALAKCRAAGRDA